MELGKGRVGTEEKGDKREGEAKLVCKQIDAYG